jgi:hypothetical protein
VRLPRLGKIKLGIKKETDRGTVYPSPTDHFVCPEEVRAVFGEKPRELRIMFPTEDESQWATQYLKCYSATRGLVCRGDGETAVARVDTVTGEIATREARDTELREITCNPGSCPYYQRQQCRRVMSLQFLLPDCPGFGVYQLNTSSFFSIVNVNSAIKLIRGICHRISMIPLSLKLVEQEVQPGGMRKSVHILSLTAPYTLAEIQRYAQVPPGEVLLLPPPDTEAPEDLFPQEVLEQEEEPIEEIPSIDEELLQAWEMVKRRIGELGIRETQLAKWFRDHYSIEVTLADFEQAVPPEKLTTRMLSRLRDSLTAYEQRQRGPKALP